LPPIDLARLADLYWNIGDAKSAASTIAEARRAFEGRELIPEQAIVMTITAARIAAASGELTDARRRLEQAKSEAERLGLLPLVFEARLAMAERSAPLKAREEAAEIERDGDRAGLGLIASKARALNRSRSVEADAMTTRTPRSAR